MSLVAPASAAASEAPDEWDRRAEKYVRFVERTRGLEFEHPVRVRFLEDAAFRKAARAWYDDTTDDDRKLAAQESDDLLALGLVTEGFDPIEASADSDEFGTLGWYDQERKEMVIRGTDVEVTEVKLTVVHELTHALQDQHFDLSELDSHARTSGEYAALGAVIEGDATLVEREFLWSLPEKARDAYWADVAAYEDGATAPEGDVPASWPLVYDLWSAFDYDLAPTALEVAIAAHGRRHVDDLFRSPPRSEEAILDPVALEEDDEPVPVRLPPFARGEEPRGPADEWGAYSWYLVLASRIPWPQALAAVEGWGGDRFRSYVQTVDGVERGCVRIAVVGDTARDTLELDTAITSWAESMPRGAAQVASTDDRVVLSACATGTAPTSADDAMQTAYDRLWERTDGMWYLTDRLFPPNTYSLCVADALVADPVAQPLVSSEDELTRREQRTLEERTDELARDCS